MDNQLIDNTLTELLRTPHAHRTPDRVLAVLSLAAEAADGTLNAATPLEKELNILHGTLAQLAADHGMKPASSLQHYPTSGSLLYGSIALGDRHFSAFGKTAAGVLANIRRSMADYEAAQA